MIDEIYLVEVGPETFAVEEPDPETFTLTEQGPPGMRGDTPELRRVADWIQWREPTGEDPTWKNLVPLADLIGEAPELRRAAGWVQWKLPSEAGTAWRNLLPLSDIKGDEGDTGPLPEHEWISTSVRFRLPSGEWGGFVDLKGEPGGVTTWAGKIGDIDPVVADIGGLPEALDLKLDDATAQSRYFTKTEINAMSFAISRITGLQDALDSKLDKSSTTAFTLGLLNDGNAAEARSTLGAASLASPGLTGTPTAPTATAATNSTQIATTAFVKAAIDALVSGSPGALDTLNELATALGNDPNFAATITGALAAKAPLTNPLFTSGAQFSDVNFKLYDQGGGKPTILFDAGDYVVFDRTSNSLSWWIGGTERMKLTASGLQVSGNNVITEALRNVANGFAGLGADGKINSSQLPASGVLSVAGKSGAVTLVAADISDAGTAGKAVLQKATASEILQSLGIGSHALIGSLGTGGGASSGEVNCGTSTVTATSSRTLAMLYGSNYNTGSPGTVVTCCNRLITGTGVSSNYVYDSAVYGYYESFCVFLNISTTPGSAVAVSHFFQNASGVSYTSSNGIMYLWAV